MAWFGVRLLIEATHPSEGERKDDLFEDRVVLVEAVDESEALEKAQRAAEISEPEYRNEFGDLVSWEFVEILGVQGLLTGRPLDGSEIFWSFLSRTEVEELRRWQGPFPG